MLFQIIQKLTARKVIKPTYTATADMVANTLTKAFPRDKFMQDTMAERVFRYLEPTAVEISYLTPRGRETTHRRGIMLTVAYNVDTV